MYELGVVHRNITRTEAAVADKLASFGSATVHEAMGRVGLMKPVMRPIYAGAQVSGTAVTVLLQPGDNWMLHVAAEQIRAGRRRGRRGDRREQRRLLRRAAGHLVQGARRARAGHRRRLPRRQAADRHGLPGVEPGHKRQGHGQGDARLGQHPRRLRRRARPPGRRDRRRRRRCGLSCRARVAAATLDAAAKREANEIDKRAKLAAGVLGLDMYKMREPLAAAGLKYID